MDSSTLTIDDLRPEQRKAAEVLLGRSLEDFQKVAIRVREGGNDIVIRFFGVKQNGTEGSTGNWNIPAYFQVLTDLSEDERADYDAVVSAPLKLSRPL